MSFTTSDTDAITDSISASGTDCAAPMRGLASLRRLALCALAGMALGGATALPSAQSANLTVSVEGLRDHKGNLLFCLTQRTAEFLKCDKDPGAVRGSVAANVGTLYFEHMVPGEWSLLMIHDSNGNGKLDKRFGIPREGFGFSRNPPIRFGPPSAEAVRFEVPAGFSHQQVKMRYIL